MLATNIYKQNKYILRRKKLSFLSFDLLRAVEKSCLAELNMKMFLNLAAYGM